MKLQLRAFLYAFFRRFVEFFLFNFVVSVMISLLAMRVPGLFERKFLVNFIFCFAGVCLMYAYLIISSWHLWASVEGAWRYYLINGVAYLLYAGIGYGFYFFLPAGASEFFLPYAFFEYLSTRFAPGLISTFGSITLVHAIFFGTVCLLPFIFHFIPINDRALPHKYF